jgi:peptidoglycan/LPS O-acetylase OafA/YrhL
MSRVSRCCKFGGDISFSLYLLHVPFLVFLNGQLIGADTRWLPDTAHLIALLGISVITLVYVTIVWQFTEARTGVARLWLSSTLEKPRTLQSAGESSLGSA